MSTGHELAVRSGNRALIYLFDHYQPFDEKVSNIVDSLPKLANGLYYDAKKEARILLRSNALNPLVRVGRGLASIFSRADVKETALANSIFDLQLTVLFTELNHYLADNEIASLLVEALLYQANGSEAGSPTKCSGA